MYYFIWNPAAGKGKAGQTLSIIKQVMDERGLKYTFLRTSRQGHATELAKNSSKDPEAKAVIAIGGDGTILETAAGLINANMPLYCIPLGNGNDYMRNFINLRKYKSVKDKTNRCLEVLLTGRRQMVDMITVNGNYALNIGNMGLDADVADLAFRIKRLFGSLSYIIAVIKSIFTYSPMEAAITADGEQRNGTFTLIAVCNGRQYGGGFIIAPQARVDDGKLTLCLVDRMPRLKILVLFPSVMFARHTKMKEISFLECEHVEIDYRGTIKMCLDGNIYDWKGPVSFKVLPAALEMIVE